jgi:hypothetical protein
MNWLGHFEFGHNRKDFALAGLAGDCGQRTADRLEHWLAQWIACYEHTLEEAPPGSLFVDHDAFRRNPERQLRRIMETCGAAMPPGLSLSGVRAPEKEEPASGVDAALAEAARQLYGRLLERSA